MVVNYLRKSMLTKRKQLKNIYIITYSSGKGIFHNIQDASDIVFNSPNFNRHAKTIIFVHGYRAIPEADDVLQIGAALEIKGSYNYLGFYYQLRKHEIDYFGIIALIPYLGNELSNFITGLIEKGVLLQNIYLLALSVGAHVAGYTGKVFKTQHNSLLPRITALDPPGFCLSNYPNITLNSGDAAYVDIIYTTVLGYDSNITGHSEYYLNSRIGYQPGCFILDMNCNHVRSTLVYIESIKNETAFIGKKCPNRSLINCDISHRSIMGFGSNTSTRGIYFLKTSSEPPYALGLEGIL